MPIRGKLSTPNVMLDSLSDNHNNPARWRRSESCRNHAIDDERSAKKTMNAHPREARDRE
jgi:hypothetical protein